MGRLKIRERIRNLTILQYSLITLFLTVSFVIALGFIITRISFNHLIKVHIDLYPALAEVILRNNPEITEMLSRQDTHAGQDADFSAVFTPLFRTTSIFRIKIWNTRNILIWSDEGGLQGEVFPENEELTEALNGQMVYSLEEATKSENSAEAGEGIVLECYIPLYDGNSVIGAFELYERSGDLTRLVRANRNTIWIGAAVFFCILYLAFFIIFYDSNSFNIRLIKNLTDTQDVTIFALAYQAEIRDNATGKHIERTTEYVRLLAEQLRKLPAYRQYITPEYMNDLVRSAPLHDIGKVGIPDSILLKPGPLTEEEFRLIKTHTTLGADTLKKAQARLGTRSFLEIAIQLAISHHEKWDGSGYPSGSAGADIPISGRIMAVADVYDALSTRRSYKSAQSHEESIRLIEAGCGTQFDPQIIEILQSIEKDFKQTSIAFSEH